MKKDLMYLTEDEARIICEIFSEPFLSFMTAKDVISWKNLNLAITIDTTSTINGDSDDSHISIFYDGRIMLSRNNGNWDRYEDINPLLAIDYLRSIGYKFEYKLPEKLERKLKIKKIEESL